MKLLLCFISQIMLVTSLYAGEKYNIYNMGDFTEGTKASLFADKVNIRKNPAIAGNNIVAQLPIGHSITIIKKTGKTFTSKNLKAPWYMISFLYNGKKMTGYVWGPLISIVTLQLTNGANTHLFLTGLTGFSKDDGFKAAAKIVIDSKIVSSVSYTPTNMPGEGNSYRYSAEGVIMKGRGLKNIKNLFLLSFTYGACGYPNGDILMLYDGKNIYYGLEAVSVAEAGVFHFNTKIIFPDQKGGLKDRIVTVETHEDFDESKKAYKITKKVKKIYTWNGRKLSKIK